MEKLRFLNCFLCDLGIRKVGVVSPHEVMSGKTRSVGVTVEVFLCPRDVLRTMGVS